MPIYQIDGLTPFVPEESFVHPTAVLIGDVILGKGVYVGPNTSLRGDFGRIVVKDGANIQDNCVMHGFPDQDTVVEEDGHIGHSAILHGCIIRRNALVGMNAVVMDGAVIGENSIVGASAFVKAKAEMPANYLIVGSPAKAIVGFTIPVLIGNIFQQFYNIADSIVAGQFIGVDALAAIGSTGSLMWKDVELIE